MRCVGDKAIGGHIDPAGDLFAVEQFLAERAFERDRHARRRLAGTDDRDAADCTQIDFFVADEKCVAFDLDVLGNQPLGQHRSNAGPPDTLDVGPKLGGWAGHR